MDIKRQAFEKWYRENNDNSVIDDARYDLESNEYDGSSYWCSELNQAWRAWQAAQKVAAPQWISVKDELPNDEHGRVLVWVVEQNSLGESGYVWNCSHTNGVFTDNHQEMTVTHWMPLPIGAN